MISFDSILLQDTADATIFAWLIFELILNHFAYMYISIDSKLPYTELHTGIFKAVVILEILKKKTKNKEHRNFSTTCITVMYIEVYISGMEMSQRNQFLVKFDIKGGFADSFSFPKCVLLYTLQYS